MLSTILVPLDGSGVAERALDYATGLAGPSGARLLLVRTTRSHTLIGVDGRERQAGAIQECEQYLEHIAARLRQQGFTCETTVPYGHAVDGIIEAARTRRADLIVMATHGRTGADRLLFGSVAEAVVTASPIPVLVQRAWQPVFGQPLLHPRPILLLPLDGSTFSESMLEPAGRLTNDLGGKLVLVRVDEDPLDIPESLEYLNAARGRLLVQYPLLSVEIDVREGTPFQGIRAAAADHQAALIAMATHGRGGLSRMVLGSVAGQLLRHAEAPLLLLRPARAAEEEELVGAGRTPFIMV